MNKLQVIPENYPKEVQKYDSEVKQLGVGKSGKVGILDIELKQNSKQKHWVLALKAVGKIDLAGADLLIKTIREVKARGGTFRIVAHFEPLIKSLERLHVLDELGKDKMYSSKFEAVNAATKDFDEHICKGCLREMFVECDRLRETE